MNLVQFYCKPSLARKNASRKFKGNTYGAIEDGRNIPTASGSSPRSEAQLEKGDSLAKVKKQVNEVKQILKDDIEKVVERDNKIGSLTDRTDNLVENSSRFRKSAVQVRKNEQRRNWKLTCCIVVIILVILAAITLIILYALKIL